jgi:hypothetical protein
MLSEGSALFVLLPLTCSLGARSDETLIEAQVPGLLSSLQTAPAQKGMLSRITGLGNDYIKKNDIGKFMVLPELHAQQTEFCCTA